MPTPRTQCEFCGVPLRGKQTRICGGLECWRALDRLRQGSSYVPPKVCAVCGVAMSLRPHGARGRQLEVCSKACRTERSRIVQLAWRQETRAERRASVKKHFATDPEKYRAQNTEYVRRWRKKYPHKQRELNRAWNLAHPEVVKARQALRRGRQLATAGHCSREQLAARVAYYGGRCWIPGCTREGNQIDHIIALARGGTNWPANLRPVCGRHNSGRRAMHWRDYLARIAC